MFHQTQFPEIPFLATNSVTASGVSAAKVVATILKPAMYQGRFLPPKKKPSMVLFVLLLAYQPKASVIRINKMMMKKSNPVNTISYI